MRTKFVIKNISVGLLSQVIIILLGFLSRKVFIDNLGAEYLGINGIMTNILSMMVIIESGIGISIVYNLYKPLAEKDFLKINILVNLYKKVYRVLAIIILFFSLLIYPFLSNLIKVDSSINGVTIVYSIFVLKNIISYLNAYKWALINADQHGYIIAQSNMFFQIITTILKIVILVYTQNYIFYLIGELIIFFIQNIVNTIIVKKRYPYINRSVDVRLDKETDINIRNNVKAMFFHNIGAYLVTSTDNLLISGFISVKAVGLYSNYTMVISQLAGLLNPITSGISQSVGNLIVTETKEKTYEVFKTTYLISFWIYCVATIFLFNLLQPFISWLFGPEYLLDQSILAIILFNFYISGMRGPISTFKNKAGLFVQDKYVAIFEGFINLIFSIIFIRIWGFIGVFLGTMMSTLLTVFWTQPKVVYVELFKKPLKEYFYTYIKYITILLFSMFITTLLCSYIETITFSSLVYRGIICVIIPNVILILCFYRTREVKYLINLLLNQLGLNIKFREINY